MNARRDMSPGNGIDLDGLAVALQDARLYQVFARLSDDGRLTLIRRSMGDATNFADFVEAMLDEVADIAAFDAAVAEAAQSQQ